MKILVDKMPEYYDDCVLAMRNHCSGKWVCRINGLPCVLETAHVCPYLAEIK